MQLSRYLNINSFESQRASLYGVEFPHPIVAADLTSIAYVLLSQIARPNSNIIPPIAQTKKKKDVGIVGAEGHSQFQLISLSLSTPKPWSVMLDM